MQDRAMVVRIVDLPVVTTCSDHPEDQSKMLRFKGHSKDQGAMLRFKGHSKDQEAMLRFKGHNKDQEAMQISVVPQKVQMQGNRIPVLQEIQAPGTPQELQVFEDLLTIDLEFNDLPADPVVQIQEVRGIQAIAEEAVIDLTEFL
jgi:hypothetical protein